MSTITRDSTGRTKLLFETKWYYISILIFAVLSLITLNKNAANEWEFSLAIRETTPILVAIAFFPALIKFLVNDLPPGTNLTVDMLNKAFGLSISREKEIENKVTTSQERLKEAGEEAKKETQKGSYIQKTREIDLDLENTITSQEKSFIQKVYRQKIYDLVGEFNRNRHDQDIIKDPMKSAQLVAEADQIVYQMRSIAPLLFDQIDIPGFLNSPNLGQQLAAIKYLDWSKDISYAEELAKRLKHLEEGDTYQAFHVLLALYSMSNHLAYENSDRIRELLENYEPKIGSDRENVKKLILRVLPPHH